MVEQPPYFHLEHNRKHGTTEEKQHFDVTYKKSDTEKFRGSKRTIVAAKK